VALSDDGQTIVSGSKDRTVNVWHFDLNYLLTKGCEQLQEYLNSHPKIDRSFAPNKPSSGKLIEAKFIKNA
jgi:WD40 repeat protein